MQIPKEYLEPKNYTGTRLIEIKDKKVYQLQEELIALKPEVLKIVEGMDEAVKVLDPAYTKMNELRDEISKIKESISKEEEIVRSKQKQLEPYEQKEQLIKNKMQPLIDKELDGQLNEFERPLHTVFKDEKIYVEIEDQLEEKVKQIRSGKSK